MSDTTNGAGTPSDSDGHDYGDSQPSGPLETDADDDGWQWLMRLGYGDPPPSGTPPITGTDIARRQPIYAYSARSHAEQAAMSAARSNLSHPSNPTPPTLRAPLNTPTGGPGARVIERQQQEKNAMAALLNAVRPRGIASPPNIADLARWSRAWMYTPFGGEMRRRKSDYGLRITIQPALPTNILALLWPSAQRIELNTALFDPRDVTAIMTELPKPSHMSTSLDRIIEASPLLRMVVALCWIRWFSWDDLNVHITGDRPRRPTARPDRRDDTPDMPDVPPLGPTPRLGETPPPLYTHIPRNMPRQDPWGPMSAQAIAFAPITDRRPFYAARGHEWERYHADYYNDLWGKLLDLLVMPEQLTAQAEVMLMQRNIPANWGARRRVVDDLARADGLDERQAEQQFIAHLAARSGVSTTLVRDRIDRPHPIRTLDDYRHLSNDVVQASPELRNWRRRVAVEWGMCDTNDLGHLALWLMEPFARVNIPQHASQTHG